MVDDAGAAGGLEALGALEWEATIASVEASVMTSET